MKSGEKGEGRRTIESIPLLRRSSKVSTVPSNNWSPDHSTPVILLVPSADAQGGVSHSPLSEGFEIHVLREGKQGHEEWAHHHNRTRRPGLS